MLSLVRLLPFGFALFDFSAPSYEIREELEEGGYSGDGEDYRKRDSNQRSNRISQVRKEREPDAGAPGARKQAAGGPEERALVLLVKPVAEPGSDVVVREEAYEAEGRERQERQMECRHEEDELPRRGEPDEGVRDEGEKEYREEDVPECVHSPYGTPLPGGYRAGTVDTMIDPRDRDLLIRDKYDGQEPEALTADLARLRAGEPLAYVIGWVPFLGLRIDLASRPLIPRPETEWWTEELIAHLRERFGDSPFALLDLCAGSGAIGLAVLKAFPNARVTFTELVPEHLESIRASIALNGLESSHAKLVRGDLFADLGQERFDVIATNPPYIPEGRTLESSVTEYEPEEALFSGEDGLSLIRRIAAGAKDHLAPGGELWLEADIENIEEARQLLAASAEKTEIRNDLYGRPRIVVGYYA